MSRITGVIQEDVQAIGEELEPILRPLSGATLLVTGGSGFLCSYFLDTVAYLNDHAWARPCRILCADNLKSGSSQRTEHLACRKDFRFIEHDVSRMLDLDEPVEWIIHGASIASPLIYRRYPLETIDVNVNGTRNMLDLAVKQRARSLLYLSTSEIYGNPDSAHIPTAEGYWGNVSCTGPRACYDESKRLAETLCLTYFRLFKTPVKIVRPFNVYGPGLKLDDGRIIPDLMRAAVSRQPIILYSDGKPTRTFCYVSDAIRAMWSIMMSDQNGAIFNIGNDQEEVTIHQVAERVRKILGPPWVEIQQRVNQDTQYLSDNPQRRCPDLTRLRTRFQWEPKVPLTDGLARTLQSFTQKCGAREAGSRG
ncbi:MAG: NAD-dependent epimerase/dehydratase family protein [Nitrospira sp.]|nr:NAD-dependent epimerase/dehydratase family protein [Nitrospira sp.]